MTNHERELYLLLGYAKEIINAHNAFSEDDILGTEVFNKGFGNLNIPIIEANGSDGHKDNNPKDGNE